jgi:DNA mismatch repair protein MutS
MRVKVLEEEGEVIFLHQVEPGTSDKSYGIEVARIAGLPSHVVERAAEVLDAITRENHLKERVRVLGERELEHVKKSARTRRRISDQQLTIFDASDLDSDS